MRDATSNGSRHERRHHDTARNAGRCGYRLAWRRVVRHAARRARRDGLALTAPPTTPDGRYIIVRGRLWRASNPSLTPAVRQTLVNDLMRARRVIGQASRDGDEAALRGARELVHAAKVALGERGPVWWTDGAPDLNRHMVRNTCYADWYAKWE